jgi:ABC-type lipoprotein export system ATPase subunit
MMQNRGSTWGKWDLHVHSPASFNWSGGQRLDKLNAAQREIVIAEWVETMNRSDVCAFAVMDYWTFDGVLALRDYCRRNPGALKKTVFPGIELRVQSPTSYRLNIHAILSDQLSDQELRDFLSELKVQILQGGLRPLSSEALRAYARSLRDDQLEKHSIVKAQLADDEYSWKVGCDTAEVTSESFRNALGTLPADSGVVLQPWDTYNGLSELKWQDHYTTAQQLFTQPDIFECKNANVRNAFVGRRAPGNSGWFDNFWKALGCRARLAVRGSDAHRFADYGLFQSGLTTWIKAAPTFRGLLQAIKEPAHRSWLGDMPPKLDRLASKPTVFIDQISLQKVAGSTLTSEQWFDGVEIQLNPDLIAVIGNKGSGKSAIADIIALLGDTGNVQSFSFLTPGRFRDKKNNRSKQFRATLTWRNAKAATRTLGEDPVPSAVERVRYVPQSYFERVCSGQSDEDLHEFTSQIERVIFAHVPGDVRRDAPDLRTLLVQQEEETVRKVQSLRTQLRNLNSRICEARRRTSPTARAELQTALEVRMQQLEDLEAAAPPDPPRGEVQDDDPKAIVLRGLLDEQDKLNSDLVAARAALAAAQGRAQAAGRLHEGLAALDEHVRQELDRLRGDATAAGVEIAKFVTFELNGEQLQAEWDALTVKASQVRAAISDGQPESLESRQTELTGRIEAARADLGSAELAVQAAREKRAGWERELGVLRGPADNPASLAYIEERIKEVDQGPGQIAELTNERDQVAENIARALLGVRAIRESLVRGAKGSIDRLIASYPSFSLEFENEMVVQGLEDRFFELIKQVSGTFRGEDEGRSAFRDFVASCSLETPNAVLGLARGLDARLAKEIRGDQVVEHDLDTLVRKGRKAEEVLDLLYSFEYLKPRFTLAQNGQPLTQLSPGQRGAMLLLFFLLVEDTDLPIILDQPEENLDNQTVYSLLVPAIKEAKERRQILMVTHNANLAVCCDAEQVIHATFDRADRHRMNYAAGPIEDPEINARVIDVLEGTRPAFENRRMKYHP